jgi:hypothetical protein
MRGISSFVKGCSVARHFQNESLRASILGRSKAAFALRHDRKMAAPSSAESGLEGIMLSK